MHHSRGDISIYIALLVGTTILGSAVLIGLILARQITLTQDLVSSERAYYAANAGVEEGLYRVARARQKSADKDNIDPGEPAPGTVKYDEQNAEYQAVITSVKNHIQIQSGILCGYISGTFNREQRFIFVGRGECI